ncbi:hypothetical protein KKE68_00860, partial [Patescibacteria group bacterium]|nr:hypothetical protein [Patescibacteria group bacterium]
IQVYSNTAFHERCRREISLYRHNIRRQKPGPQIFQKINNDYAVFIPSSCHVIPAKAGIYIQHFTV